MLPGRRWLRAGLVVALGAVLSGCGGGGGSASPSDAGSANPLDAPGAYCLKDPRAQTYSAGIERKSSKGTYSIRIDDASPAPPNVGNNEWTIDLVDADGKPVDGATFTVKPWMPDHGHGSAIVPTVTSKGGGKYHVTLLDLFMPGLWQITFTVETAAGTDDVMFSFCVLG